jgi:hypothetical protein
MRPCTPAISTLVRGSGQWWNAVADSGLRAEEGARAGVAEEARTLEGRPVQLGFGFKISEHFGT